MTVTLWILAAFLLATYAANAPFLNLYARRPLAICAIGRERAEIWA